MDEKSWVLTVALCRGLEEVQVEREEVIEINFKGDVESVEDLDRIFG